MKTAEGAHVSELCKCYKMLETAQFHVELTTGKNNIFLFMYISIPLHLFLCSSGKNSDSQNALNDLAQYEFLAQLRKASTSASLLDHMNHNGMAAVYYQGSRHDELPPAIWSPGAQSNSPEGAGRLTWRGCTVSARLCVASSNTLSCRVTVNSSGKHISDCTC